MGCQGLAPKGLARVHQRLQAPILATVLVTIVVWLFAIALPLLSLAKITSFIIIIAVSLLINISLIKVLRKEASNKAVDSQHSKKVLSISMWIPILGVVMCAMFLMVQIYQLFMQVQFSGD